MYEKSQMIIAPKVYTLEELHQLFVAEGNFDDEYELITKKTLIPHIRFPGLKKTAIEVYPDVKGQSAVVVNLTKASRGKDFAVSILTDGWSDILSSGQSDNEFKVAKICEELRRLFSLSTGAPASAPAAPAAAPPPAPTAPVEQAAPPPATEAPTAPAPAAAPAPPPAESSGLPPVTETYSGFKTLRTKAFDDHIELVHEKKNKTTEIPYDNILELETKKDTMTFTLRVGGVEVLVFKSKEECAKWDEFIRSKMQ